MSLDILQEAFKKLSILNEEAFDVTDDGIKDFSQFVEPVESDMIDVIDPDAEDDDFASNASHIGQLILQCNVCKLLQFKNSDDITFDEDGIAQVEAPCPDCGENHGFVVIGKVCPLADEPAADEPISDEEDVIEPNEDDENKSDEPTIDDFLDLAKEFLSDDNFEKVQKMLDVEDEDDIDDDDEDDDVDDSDETIDESLNESAKSETVDSFFTSYTVDDDGVVHENESLDTDCSDVCPECGKKVCECDKSDITESAGEQSDCYAIRYIKNGKFLGLDGGLVTANWKLADKFDTREAAESVANDLGDDYSVIHCDCKTSKIIDEDKNSDEVCPKCGKKVCECNECLTESIKKELIEHGYCADNNAYIEKVAKHIRTLIAEGIDYSASKWFEIMNESYPEDLEALGHKTLDEDIENMHIETEQQDIDIVSDSEGNTNVSIEAKSDDEDEDVADVAETVEPLADTDIEDIIDQQSGQEDNDPEMEADIESEGEEDVEPEDDFIDLDVDEIDEESFNHLGQKYLQEVYDNIESFKLTDVKASDDKFIAEGCIKFNSGKSKKTSFVFEAKNADDLGNVKFIGENLQIPQSKNGFELTGKVENKSIISESLSYKYSIDDNEVDGIVHAAD